MSVKPINWNTVPDEKDLDVWNRLTGNFWLPERVPVSNDIPSWNQLTDEEREVTMRVFTGLTLLDTVHGYYIGYKYQKHLQAKNEQGRHAIKEMVFDLLYDLYDNECQYTEDIYDPLGLTEQVKVFLRYNANKALNNLGYEGLFPTDETQVSPEIMAQLSPNADENHDFFSGSGSSYVMGRAEDTSDDDWEF